MPVTPALLRFFWMHAAFLSDVVRLSSAIPLPPDISVLRQHGDALGVSHTIGEIFLSHGLRFSFSIPHYAACSPHGQIQHVVGNIVDFS
jgi:hypothetical protein